MATFFSEGHPSAVKSNFYFNTSTFAMIDY